MDDPEATWLHAANFRQVMFRGELNADINADLSVMEPATSKETVFSFKVPESRKLMVLRWKELKTQTAVSAVTSPEGESLQWPQALTPCLPLCLVPTSASADGDVEAMLPPRMLSWVWLGSLSSVTDAFVGLARLALTHCITATGTQASVDERC